MTTEELNKQVIRSYMDAMQQGTLEQVQGYCAPGAINHASDRAGQQLPTGPEGIGIVVQLLRTAFPDRRWQIDDLLAEGDLVACRMTVSGTFGTKPRIPFPVPPGSPGVEGTQLVGPSASGKPYSVKQLHIFRLSGGLIAEHWAGRDDLGLLLQLGALSPDPVGQSA